MEFDFYGISGATFTLRPSLALSYIGSVTALHLSSGRQPNFAALRGRHVYSAGRPSHFLCFAEFISTIKLSILHIIYGRPM